MPLPLITGDQIAERDMAVMEPLVLNSSLFSVFLSIGPTQGMSGQINSIRSHTKVFP